MSSQTVRFVYRENVGSVRALRLIDGIAATAALFLAAPVLAAAMAAIWLEDGRPIFYRQMRIGRFGRVFVMWKLRTMKVEDCADRPSPTNGDDPRTTRVGRFLRKRSIDELPQLLNVLRGDMSFIGPRPEMPFLVRAYAEKWQHLRYVVRPGLTCTWQVTMRSTVPLNRPAATVLDLEYIQKKSPALDASVIARTFLALIFPKGAY